MQSTICILFIAITVLTCRAKIEIIQDNGISIEFDKPLTIRCTNDRTSDVEFRHEQLVVAYCLGKHGCNIDDGRFNITQNTSAGRNEYILTSKDTIQPDLCGVYECKDLLFPEKDSAQVSIIGFDTEKYNATEEKDTIYLTTACTFHVSLSDMQIVWYTYDNTILRLLDETRMGHSMTPFNSASVCSDECDTISAYRFTFGLNITDQEQGYTDVFIETEIFHPDYKNKPLTWRSSNTFRVKDSSPKTSISWVALSFIVLASVLVTVLIAGAIYVLIRFRRRRMNRAGTYIHTNTEKSMNRALRIRESMPRFRSRGKKAAKSRHVGTQPVGESVRDSQSGKFFFLQFSLFSLELELPLLVKKYRVLLTKCICIELRPVYYQTRCKLEQCVLRLIQCSLCIRLSVW
ncbi:uncharacterized protein LOC128234082 isoform X2 [Mya arenaria]|nr:uncharacterized protein LOC128234082 isoform X2 [Mya arenaria]